MDNKNMPNYYSVIPANVRYCKDLTFFEIVLYSEISALSNAFGYCFASNSYFAKLYDKTTRTITSSIKNLEDMNFIKTVIDKENGNLRKIYLQNKIINVDEIEKIINEQKKENFYTPIEKNFHTPIEKNDTSPIENNFQYNITSDNTTSLFKEIRAREREEWLENQKAEVNGEKLSLEELFKRVYKKNPKK